VVFQLYNKELVVKAVRMRDSLVFNPKSLEGFIEVEGPPFDDNGNELSIYNGMEIPRNIRLNYLVSGNGEIPDFVNNLSVHILVSSRAWDVIANADIRSVTRVPVAIRDRHGHNIEEIHWLNVGLRSSLMSESESDFRKMPSGHFLSIEYFSVRANDMEEDIVICEETRSKIFSRRLFEMIRSAGLIGADFLPLHGYQWP
jgi:hypothetical protein